MHHARIPTDHRILRGRFLASTIPQPTDADRQHNDAVDRSVTVMQAGQRQARRRAGEKASNPTKDDVQPMTEEPGNNPHQSTEPWITWLSDGSSMPLNQWEQLKGRAREIQMGVNDPENDEDG